MTEVDFYEATSQDAGIVCGACKQDFAPGSLIFQRDVDPFQEYREQPTVELVCIACAGMEVPAT